LGKDDLRDKAEGRDAVFAVLKVTNRNHKPFITLSGDKNLRLEKAIALSMICQRLKNGVIVARFCKFTTYDLKMFVAIKYIQKGFQK
jgi:hypothetical protein